MKDALPVLQRAYQSAQETENKALMAKLTMDTANILFNAGNKYEEAVSYYRRLEQIDPKTIRSLSRSISKRLAFIGPEYYNEAAETWEKLSVKYPRDDRRRSRSFRASRTRFELGKYPEAVAGYQTLVAISPNRPCSGRAVPNRSSLFQRKNWPKAIEAYMDFQTLFPGDPEFPKWIITFKWRRIIRDVGQRNGRKISWKNQIPGVGRCVLAGGGQEFQRKKYDAARDNFRKSCMNSPARRGRPRRLFTGRNPFSFKRISKTRWLV
jgi:tetratricopeptide (TPR) repeat protein